MGLMRYLGLHQACIRHAQHKNSVRFCALPTAGLKSIALGMTESKPINASENPQTPATGQVEDGSPKPADGLNAIPRTPPGLHSFFFQQIWTWRCLRMLEVPNKQRFGREVFFQQIWTWRSCTAQFGHGTGSCSPFAGARQ